MMDLTNKDVVELGVQVGAALFMAGMYAGTLRFLAKRVKEHDVAIEKHDLKIDGHDVAIARLEERTAGK